MDWTNWLKQFGRYIVIMILQVFLFDQLQFLGVCHPYIYVMCLLLMPITLRPSVDMIIGASVGLIMDIFSNTLGVHMAACIGIMYFRRPLLALIVNDRDRLNEQITIRSIGLLAMIEYVAILVFIHHLAVFTLAAWSLHHMGFVLLETLVSGLFTAVLIIAYNALRNR